MRTDISKVLTAGMLTGMIIAGYCMFNSLPQEPAHDHKVYTRSWGNGLRHTTFTVCGDSTVVTSQGHHWGFIPKGAQPHIKPENRVK